MRPDDNPDDLLAAYVDGVTELSPDERRRVEARLEDPAVRRDEQATRAVIGQLRELPPAGAEPDWSALERSIHEAVGPAVPRSWWRGWRWAIPAIALATAAIIIVVVQRPERRPSVAVSAPAPAIPHVEPAPATDTFALWLDGREVDIPAAASDDLLDDPLVGLDDPAFVDGLLAPSDLAWAIDELDDEALDRAEQLLEHPQRKKG